MLSRQHDLDTKAMTTQSESDCLRITISEIISRFDGTAGLRSQVMFTKGSIELPRNTEGKTVSFHGLSGSHLNRIGTTRLNCSTSRGTDNPSLNRSMVPGWWGGGGGGGGRARENDERCCLVQS